MSQLNWLVRERHRYVALWLYSATIGSDKDESQRLFAIALALDSAVKAIDAHHRHDGDHERWPTKAIAANPAIDRSQAINRSEEWKRIPRPADDVDPEDYRVDGSARYQSSAFDRSAVIAIACLGLLALIFVR